MEQGTRSGIIVATFAAVVMCSTVAMSQTSKEWQQCGGREGPIVDVVISGCSVVIQANQGTPQSLATAFNNRGVAYRFKGEYDRAITDYDEAILLNPSFARAHNNRGVIYRLKADYDRAISDYSEGNLATA
jgi:tetratricopeptide (TPR) repeat protein